MVIARYELVLRGPPDADRLIEAMQTLPPLLREAEENLTIMLPQDFHVVITPADGAAKMGDTAHGGG